MQEDITLEFFASNDGTQSYTATGGGGLCFEVTWRGADGASLGTSTIQIPGSGQVPAGTVSFYAKKIDCPEDLHFDDERLVAGNGRFAHSHQGNRQQATASSLNSTVWVFGGPVVPDLTDGGPFKNAIYSFLVTVSNPAEDPFLSVLPILAGGVGSFVPPNVDLLSFTQFVPDLLGGRMIAADTEPFEMFRLDWNGQVAFADLASGTNVVPFNVQGWSAVEAFVPLTSFNGQSVPNYGKTMRKTATQLQPIHDEATCVYTN